MNWSHWQTQSKYNFGYLYYHNLKLSVLYMIISFQNIDYRFQKQQDPPMMTQLPGRKRTVNLLGRRVWITSTQQSVLPTNRTLQLPVPSALPHYPRIGVGLHHRQTSMKLCSSSTIKGTSTYSRDELALLKHTHNAIWHAYYGANCLSGQPLTYG